MDQSVVIPLGGDSIQDLFWQMFTHISAHKETKEGTVQLDNVIPASLEKHLIIGNQPQRKAAQDMFVQMFYQRQAKLYIKSG